MRQHQMYVVDTTPIYSNLHLFNQEQHIAELSQAHFIPKNQRLRFENYRGRNFVMKNRPKCQNGMKNDRF